jgi:hypothetical protein
VSLIWRGNNQVLQSGSDLGYRNSHGSISHTQLNRCSSTQWRENQREKTRQPKAFPARDHPVCCRARDCPRRGLETVACVLDGRATADLDSLCARQRRESTVGAKESLRRGRTKERPQARKKSLRPAQRLERGAEERIEQKRVGPKATSHWRADHTS